MKKENPLAAVASGKYKGGDDDDDGDDIVDLPANANEDAVRREQRAMSIVDEHNYKIGRKVRPINTYFVRAHCTRIVCIPTIPLYGL